MNAILSVLNKFNPWSNPSPDDKQNQRDEYIPDKLRKRWPIPRPPLRDTIKCPGCGYDTGLNKNGFLMVIPPEGLICHKCGAIILRGRDWTL